MLGIIGSRSNAFHCSFLVFLIEKHDISLLMPCKHLKLLPSGTPKCRLCEYGKCCICGQRQGSWVVLGLWNSRTQRFQESLVAWEFMVRISMCGPLLPTYYPPISKYLYTLLDTCMIHAYNSTSMPRTYFTVLGEVSATTGPLFDHKVWSGLSS